MNYKIIRKGTRQTIELPSKLEDMIKCYKEINDSLILMICKKFETIGYKLGYKDGKSGVSPDLDYFDSLDSFD